jgi:hypothetical protein
MTQTMNGENALSGTGRETVDLFFNIGSARNAQERVEGLFDKALQSEPELTAAILAWARDARGGAGERETFRNLLRKLIKVDQKLATKLLKLAPTLGRFDDLRSGFNTSLEDVAVKIWADAIEEGNELAHKWVNIKKDHRLRKHMKMSNKEFRKKIVAGRPNIVEKKMCGKEWVDITYEHVPSVCMKKNANVFRTHDGKRFDSWINDGDAKVNASVLFPHQIYQTWKQGLYSNDNSAQLASKQWKALEMEIGANILPMVDTSSSMDCTASKGVTCMEVAISLGAFLAQKNTGSFKNKFLTFSEKSTLQDLPETDDVGQVFESLRRSDWGMSTNFQSAYQAILNEAVQSQIPKEQMPEYLVVLSDMQFDEATGNNRGAWRQVDVPSYETAFGKMRVAFEQSGYEIPKVIFWNLNAGYDNYPSSSTQDGVALVSGFSPFVMKAVVDADLDRISPESIMVTTVEKYQKMIADA